VKGPRNYTLATAPAIRSPRSTMRRRGLRLTAARERIHRCAGFFLPKFRIRRQHLIRFNSRNYKGLGKQQDKIRI